MMGDPYRENESCAGCESRDRTITNLREERFDRWQLRGLFLLVAGMLSIACVGLAGERVRNEARAEGYRDGLCVHWGGQMVNGQCSRVVPIDAKDGAK